MPQAIPLIIGAIVSTVISVGIKLVASALTPKPKTQAQSLDQRQQGTTVTARQPIAYWRIGYGTIRVGGQPIYMGTTENNDKFHVVAACLAHQIESFDEFVIGEHWLHADDLDADGATLSGGPLFFSGNPDVRLQTKLGTANQTAFADLVTETAGEWSDAHRARGHALLYVRYQFQPTIFPGGLPNQSAVARAKNDLYDPRDGQTRWTDNFALCVRDYLVRPKELGGYGMAAVDETNFAAAANICDEIVASPTSGAAAASHTAGTVSASGDYVEVDGEYLKFQVGDRIEVESDGAVPGGLAADTDYYAIPYRRRACKITTSGAIHHRPAVKFATSLANARAGTAIDITDAGTGTITVFKTGEPRWTLNGTFTCDQDPKRVLEEMLASAGAIVPEGAGLMRLMGLAWEAPTLALDEDDLRGPLIVQTKRGPEDIFNTVRGTYVTPLNDYQPSDYPAVSASNYVAEDGETISADYPQPYTSRAGQAQRAAKKKLAENRFQRTIRFPALLTGYDCKVGENVAVSNTRRAWNQKAFQILEWKPRLEQANDRGAPYLGTDLAGNETDASVYDWSSTEEQAAGPVIAPTLPNWRFVPPPTSLYARTQMVPTDSGDIVYTAILSWAMSTGVIVDRGGWFELQTRRTLGSALEFDGTDDFVQLGASIDLTSTGGFTVEGWAEWDGLGTNDRGIFANGQLSVYRRNSDGKLVADLATTSVTLTVESDSALVDDDVFHWAVTWDGQTLSLYIDAVLNDTDDLPASESTRITEGSDIRITEGGDTRVTEDVSATLDATITPQIGRGKGGTADTAYWDGMIDELRIWRGRVKTATEIADEKDEGLTGREDGLLHYYPCDQEFAAELVDATIAGNHGTITGALYTESGALPPAWESSWTVDGVERSAPMPMLRAAHDYDIRIRAFNALGVFSDWSALDEFTVGTSAGATESEDWGSVAAAGGDGDEDWAAITDSVSETADWGSVV